MGFKRISIDTFKHVFTLHGIDEQDRVILRRELLLKPFFARKAPVRGPPGKADSPAIRAPLRQAQQERSQ